MTNLADAIKYEVWYREYLRSMANSSLSEPVSRKVYASRIIFKGRRF